MENDVNTLRHQLQQIVFKQACEQTKNPYSREVFKQLTNCHTATQGLHRLRCSDSDCMHEQYQYHNCGNRHCPNCGGMRREQWLEDKTNELLPTSYFHCVFTVPHELNSLTMGNRKLMFDLLFEASSYTVLKLCKDEQWLGATPGIISILHTWGQDISFHPHVHCIVSGGGVKNEKWVAEKRKNHKYLFPKSSMEKVYKAYYLKRIHSMLRKNELQVKDKYTLENTLNDIAQKRWNVYAKDPFGGPLQVLQYLGRYTHKVAITAHRIKKIDVEKSTITFEYKDYHARGTKDERKEMTLTIDEFIRRYEQHILPKRYTKIRHYGYLKNYKRTERLKQLFALLKLPPPPPKILIPVRQRMLEKYGKDIMLCPKCEKAKQELVATYRKGVLCKTYETSEQETNNKSP
ncbi:MAG: IS91 family transposase [Ferruginibacter sp.]